MNTNQHFLKGLERHQWTTLVVFRGGRCVAANPGRGEFTHDAPAVCKLPPEISVSFSSSNPVGLSARAGGTEVAPVPSLSGWR